jgi:hypothetical protein
MKVSVAISETRESASHVFRKGAVRILSSGLALSSNAARYSEEWDWQARLAPSHQTEKAVLDVGISPSQAIRMNTGVKLLANTRVPIENNSNQSRRDSHDSKAGQLQH